MNSKFILVVFISHFLITIVQLANAQRKRILGRPEQRWTSWLLDVARILVLCSSYFELHVRKGTTNLLISLLGIGALVIIFAAKQWVINTLTPYWSRDIEIRENHQLVTFGPYAWVRHPHYALNILELLFLPVIANAWVSEIVAVVLATIAYSIRIPREEQALIRAFGEEYIAYCRSVPCLLPLRRKTK